MNVAFHTRNVLLLWLCLFFISLPFTFAVIPEFGVWIFRSWSQFVELFLEDELGIWAQSDSSMQWTSTGILSLLATIIYLILLFTKLSMQRVCNVMETIVVWFLAMLLFKYGLDKIFLYQFYTPDPNTLHQSLGSLGKDQLFWSSMGTSPGYSRFLGILECIPAILILFKRTRFLGLIISCGVLMHVFAINLGFDITVKLLSGIMLLSSIILLIPYRERLIFLIKPNHAYNEQKEIVETKNWHRLAWSLCFSLLLLEGFYPYINRGLSGPKSHKLVGSYEVMSDEYERIHIHRNGYFISESNGNLVDESITFINDQSFSKNNRKWTYEDYADGGAFISINDTLYVEKIETSDYPALKNELNWTLESKLNSD